MERFRSALGLVTEGYKAIVVELDRLGLQDSNKVMRGGKFTGWLWEAAGLMQEREERKEKEREECKNRSAREA